MKKISLTRRLIGAVVISQLVLLLAVVVVATVYCFRHLQSAFDVNLEGRAFEIATLVYPKSDGQTGLQFDETKIPPSHHVIHKDIYFIRSDDGAFMWHAGDNDLALFKAIPARDNFWNFEQDGEPYRAIILRSLPIPDRRADHSSSPGKMMVVYASPTMDIAQRVEDMAQWIALASVLLFMPSCLLSVWSIRRTLAPLNSLAHDARCISSDNWRFEPSSEARASQELQPLIEAIENVLAGLQRSFQRQRDFLGDAAHELKTSFAILKSSSQTLLNQPRTAEEYRLGLANMSEDGDRLEQLLHRMLLLARAEQWAADGTNRELDVIDLAATCEMAIGRIRKIADERRITIDLLSCDQVFLCADPADLELVWLNLLENAVQASPADSKVKLAILPQGKEVIVSVSDEGVGIPNEDLKSIFERFRRGDPSRSRTTGGFGLGLAIAKSIVEAYKGSIHAESSVGLGTTMSVHLVTDGSSQIVQECEPVVLPAWNSELMMDGQILG